MNDVFLNALQITGYGMLGIFVFMVVFYFTVVLLLKWFPEKDKPI
jgi:hypothetical protein